MHEPTLKSLASDLWDAQASLNTPLLHLPLRMTVVGLPSGGLWLHSPIPINDTLAQALAELGEVEHIVAPNRFHYLYAAAAKQRYPRATLWATPGLPEKCKDIQFDAVLNERETWGDTLRSILIRGFPTLSESVFFHPSSRTLICSDLIFNINSETHGPTRMMWRVFGVWRKGLAQNRVWRLMRRDRVAAAEAIGRVLQWDIERIVMAHGDVADQEPLEGLRRALEWITR